MKTSRLLLFFICIVLLVSCQKARIEEKTNIEKSETVPLHENQRLGASSEYAEFLTALETMRESSNDSQAEKIDSLLAHISFEGMQVFELEEDVEVYICDLSTYRNASVPEYGNTYYKLYLTKRSGQFEGGCVYTIHTDDSKQNIDSDLEQIFLQTSENFSGVTVVNQLSDRFVQSLVFDDGELAVLYTLSPSDQNRSSNARVDNCKWWHVVRTTVFADGHTEQEVLYEFEICDGCVPAGQIATTASTLESDCDEQGGGGGEVEVQTTDHMQTEELDVTDVINMEAGTTCRGRFIYPYAITKLGDKTIDVTPEFAQAVPANQTCAVNNRACIRTCGVQFHVPRRTPLGTSWWLTWGFNAHYVWAWADSAPHSTLIKYNYKSITVF